MGILRRVYGIFTDKRIGNIAVIIFLLGAAYLFLVRGARFFAVPSASMEPTLFPGDQLMTLRMRSYQRGDIVVFREDEQNFAVKRIAGLGGDELVIAESALFINGSYASEPYIFEPMLYQLVPPVTVPAGEMFVLGDNRNNSEDSSLHRRTWPVTSIVGKVVFRHYPYERFGRVRSYPLKTAAELGPQTAKGGEVDEEAVGAPEPQL